MTVRTKSWLERTREGCVFCRMIDTGHGRPTDWEQHGQKLYSFTPLNPVTPGHRLFIPHRHEPSANMSPVLTGELFQEAAQWGARRHEQFNLIINSGKHATQTVFHLHAHYVPRAEGDGLALPWTGQNHEA